jgi:hypothetical protein
MKYDYLPMQSVPIATNRGGVSSEHTLTLSQIGVSSSAAAPSAGVLKDVDSAICPVTTFPEASISNLDISAAADEDTPICDNVNVCSEETPPLSIKNEDTPQACSTNSATQPVESCMQTNSPK